MLEELAPEIIWIAGLGTIVVFGLMMVVWFLSTRESSSYKKRDPPPQATTTSLRGGRVKRRQQQYGSPRKKKDVISGGGADEHSDTELVVSESSDELPVTTEPQEETIPPPPPPPQQRRKENEESKKKVTKSPKVQSSVQETHTKTKTQDVKPSPAASEPKGTTAKTQVLENKTLHVKEEKPEESRPSPKKVKTKGKQSAPPTFQASGEGEDYSLGLYYSSVGGVYYYVT